MQGTVRWAYHFDHRCHWRFISSSIPDGDRRVVYQQEMPRPAAISDPRLLQIIRTVGYVAY